MTGKATAYKTFATLSNLDYGSEAVNRGRQRVWMNKFGW